MFVGVSVDASYESLSPKEVRAILHATRRIACLLHSINTAGPLAHPHPIRLTLTVTRRKHAVARG